MTNALCSRMILWLRLQPFAMVARIRIPLLEHCTNPFMRQFINYNNNDKCAERFGVVPDKRSLKLLDSMRQRELKRLKGEKKPLRRRWKVANEDEGEGLSYGRMKQDEWGTCAMRKEWDRGNTTGDILKEKNSGELNQFRPINATECKGENVFLHHGFEAYRVCDV